MLVVCGLASYLVPGLDRVRPWVSGEGFPVARLFTERDHEREQLPEFEGGEVLSGDALGSSPAQSTGGDVIPTPSNLDDGALPPDTEGPAAGTGLQIDPSEYAGAAQAIEFPEALANFYAALRKSAQGEAGAITRVAHYGDSAIAADEITTTLRRKLQKRFGDAGHGFMLIAHSSMHYLHRDVAHHESDGWEMISLVERKLKGGRYGYGGVLAKGSGGERAVFGTVKDAQVGRSVSRFELAYQKFPSGGEVRVSIDGKLRSTLSTRASEVEDAWESFEVPDGSHSISVRANGNEVHLYGVVQERDVAGVVYDSVGMVGAQAERLLNADPDAMAAQIAHRNPDLLVLGFGGNEAGNEWLDPERYAATLAKVIKLMRKGKPEMSCLLFAPLDQGEKNARGDLVTLKVLPDIVEAQRRVAKQEGCAYFDTFHAMGGINSVARWYRKHPRLIGSDFRHATPLGYDVVGNLYYQALLKGFAEYLAKAPKAQ
jgi:lysophospholipase L1-like esterase